MAHDALTRDAASASSAGWRHSNDLLARFSVLTPPGFSLVGRVWLMGLHLADGHLESARLHLAQGNQDKAREHLATAREMVERMGYHRHDNEVGELAEQLQ
jgi:hypothetical protein